MAKLEEAVDLLGRLLAVTELNMDDMEPETHAVVSEASACLADYESRTDA